MNDRISVITIREGQPCRCGQVATCWNVNGPACQPNHSVVIERPKEWAPIRTRPWAFFGTREELKAEEARRITEGAGAKC